MNVLSLLSAPEGGLCAALAPMAGVTDHVMRVLCARQGARFSVTEMVNAQGYLCAPENRKAIERLLYTTPEEGCVGVQLFGRDPAAFAQAARRLYERGFAFIDINMGCPARKVVSGGSGSALLKEPKLCFSLVEAVRKAVPCPVSVKLRLGWDEGQKNAPLIAKICQEAGADFLTVHGRTREQQYAGQADWEGIRQVVEAVQIPVLGNGDIRTASQARERMQKSGCAGVAIGRGARGNPFLFAAMASGQDAEPTPRMRIEAACTHLQALCDWQGESWGVIEARKHLAWYLYGLRGAAEARSRLMTLSQKAAVEEELLSLLRRIESAP